MLDQPPRHHQCALISFRAVQIVCAADNSVEAIELSLGAKRAVITRARIKQPAHIVARSAVSFGR